MAFIRHKDTVILRFSNNEQTYAKILHTCCSNVGIQLVKIRSHNIKPELYTNKKYIIKRSVKVNAW